MRGVIPLLLVLLAACATPPAIDVRAPGPAVPRFVRVKLSVSGAGRSAIQELPLEDYVQGAILSEFAPSAVEVSLAARMYEVQAIVSRTYAVANTGRHAAERYDLCATTHCQLYEPSRLRTSRWAKTAKAAAAATAGEVLWFGRAPAVALFHADCGGHTSAAASVWGGRDRPYLAAVLDNGPASAAHQAWHFEASQADLQRALNTNARTRVGGRLDTIEVLDRDAAGRAEYVALHGAREAIVRGEELRDVLARTFGARSVRSTRFTVRRDGARFTFEGRGFGHGVGLCQAGALARLRAGLTPADVLATYFPGTTIHP